MLFIQLSSSCYVSKTYDYHLICNTTNATNIYEYLSKHPNIGYSRISISNGSLERFPRDFLNHISTSLISYVEINYNQIQVLKLSQLDYFDVDLQYNNIEVLEGAINSTRLEALNLGFNKLTYIPSNWIQFAHLRRLYLKNNEIIFFDNNTFDNLTSLYSLDLSRNKLTELPLGLFKNLNKLGFLYLSNNLLIKLEGGSFYGLYKLHSLDLSYNELRNLLGYAFHDLTSLTTLDLVSNEITEINTDFLYQLPLACTIKIDNNLIACKTLHKMIIETKFTSKTNFFRGNSLNGTNIKGIACKNY